MLKANTDYERMWRTAQITFNKLSDKALFFLKREAVFIIMQHFY